MTGVFRDGAGGKLVASHTSLDTGGGGGPATRIVWFRKFEPLVWTGVTGGKP